jgi:RND family efflux transporter MFP subunit
VTTATKATLAAIFAAAVFLCGCEGCRSHEHPHADGAGDDPGHAHGERGDHAEEHGDHEHGDEAVGITRFTDELELFAEHPPAVSGQKLPFLAHLTILAGFEPLEKATVTLVLEGPERVEARVTEQLRPGIFRPVLTAPAPGTYRGRLLVAGPGVEDTIAGFEVVVHANAAAAKRAAAQEPAAPQTITFLKEQQWQVPFATAFAEQGTVVPTVEVAGEVTTPPSGQAEVGAAVAGRVVAPASGLPRPGQVVKKGALLATIAAAPAAPEDGARADLAVVEAEARLQAARAQVERAERLIAARAISQREVDEARRELTVADEAVRAARRARDVFSGAASGRGAGTYRVTAPIEGVVVEVTATQGKSVASGEPLLRIVNLDELWIRARVPEQQAALLRSDEDAAFKLPDLDTWLPLDVTGADAAASVVNIGRTVDRRSRTVDVIYALRDPDERLRVGAMLRVAVPAGKRWQGVVVPREAILEDDGRSIVYVQLEGETFEERVVRVGPRAGSLAGIERGIVAHERVVVRGANVVRLSARASTAATHGHVH